MSRPARPDPEEVAWRIEDDRSTRCAILPPMPTPPPPSPPVPAPPSLSELAQCAVAATLNSAGAWARLPPAEQQAVKARLRWVLDEAAKRRGVEPGAWYGVSPVDPPPTQPGQ